jgi:hypothetical protein
MMAGTSIVPEGHTAELSDHEIAVRHMALVNRFTRRIYGAGILEALKNGRIAPRFMRAFLPRDAKSETGFFFMTLQIPNIDLAGGYEQYRAARRNMLETYALTLWEKTPHLKRIVGIGTEPPSSQSQKNGSSEDLIYVEQPTWTDDLRTQLAERQRVFSIGENTTQHDAHGDEFPVVEARYPSSSTTPPSLNRRERRRLQAEARRSSRKGR